MLQRFLVVLQAALLWTGSLIAQTPPAARLFEADQFTLQEVDQGRELTLRYADVRKARIGYGNTRNIRGQRIHPRTKLIVTLAVVGGLLALVFVAVASDKS